MSESFAQRYDQWHDERDAMQEAQHQLEHERQARTLAALDIMQGAINDLAPYKVPYVAETIQMNLDFLARELGVWEQWHEK